MLGAWGLGSLRRAGFVKVVMGRGKRRTRPAREPAFRNVNRAMVKVLRRDGSAAADKGRLPPSGESRPNARHVMERGGSSAEAARTGRFSVQSVRALVLGNSVGRVLHVKDPEEIHVLCANQPDFATE